MEVAAFKYNRKVFDSERLLLDDKLDRRKLKILVDMCLGMVIKKMEIQ